MLYYLRRANAIVMGELDLAIQPNISFYINVQQSKNFLLVRQPENSLISFKMMFKALITLALAAVALGENCAQAEAKAQAALDSGTAQGNRLLDDGQFQCILNSNNAIVCSDSSGGTC